MASARIFDHCSGFHELPWMCTIISMGYTGSRMYIISCLPKTPTIHIGHQKFRVNRAVDDGIWILYKRISGIIYNTPPKFNIAPEKWWLETFGNLLSYWEGNFSGAMLNCGGHLNGIGRSQTLINTKLPKMLRNLLMELA